MDHIFEWFKRNTQSGSQLVGPAYVGAFYYDSSFWPLVIPIVYGTVALDPFESLKATPAPVITELRRSPKDATALLGIFADCANYGLYAQDVATSKSFAPPGQELFWAADKALISCAELLVPARPNGKSLELARDAVEIFLKSYLAGLHGATDNKLRSCSHDLDKSLAACEAAAHTELSLLTPHLHLLPDIQERYSAQQWPLRRLWDGYRIAQSVGATVVRIVTGNDVRRNFVAG